MTCYVGGELNSSLVDSLVRVARDAFGTKITDDDARNHILKVDYLHLIYCKDELVGFASYDTFELCGKSTLYLSGVAIASKMQNRGLSYYAISSAISHFKPKFFAMRTQNVLMYHLANKFSPNIYPSISAENNLEERKLCVAIGLELSQKLKMQNYQKELFIERGTYGIALNKKAQHTTDSRASALFESLRIDRVKGDSVIVIVKL